MGMFTPRDTVDIDQAKVLEPTTITVCPHCQEEIEMGPKTLEAENPMLGIKMHRCPLCKQLITV
jgi:hypothetical protein